VKNLQPKCGRQRTFFQEDGGYNCKKKIWTAIEVDGKVYCHEVSHVASSPKAEGDI